MSESDNLVEGASLVSVLGAATAEDGCLRPGEILIDTTTAVRQREPEGSIEEKKFELASIH